MLWHSSDIKGQPLFFEESLSKVWLLPCHYYVPPSLSQNIHWKAVNEYRTFESGIALFVIPIGTSKRSHYERLRHYKPLQ